MKKGMMALAIFLTLNVFAGVSSNFSFSSNYFWRGMSQTMDAPAYSGGFDYSSEGGFYAGTWGSNVAFGGAGLELDLYAGYAGETESGFGYDIGYIQYAYPETDGLNFSEMYGSLSYEAFGFTYYLGDEFGDYYEFSYGVGPVSFSYGDYEDTGSNYLVSYAFSLLGKYDASVAYSSFMAENMSELEDEDGLFFTVGASF
jgi:uncharacterized protein (TIGR02001 family)